MCFFYLPIDLYRKYGKKIHIHLASLLMHSELYRKVVNFCPILIFISIF